MKPILSFLVGSGFSIPDGIPGTVGVNQRLSKIDESEIFIHSSQIADFLNGQVDNNRHTNRLERFFVQEFLEFYNSRILKNGESFDYEVFFDFYYAYLRNNLNKEIIEEFNTGFNKKHLRDTIGSKDCQTQIRDFNRTYSQLLSSFLKSPKYYDDRETAGYPYLSLIHFLKETLKRYDIKIHSLNHDILFDWLGHNNSLLSPHFSDGFQLEGSIYYGNVYAEFEQSNSKEKIWKSYYVKLEQFANKFDTSICLFKLHGSVSNKIIYTPLNNNIIIEPSEGSFGRIKDNYRVSDYYMELPDNKTSDKLTMRQLMDKVEPDILTGKTEKMFQYDTGYYKNLFEHFKKNLTNSELLIVIGYGFLDDGINERLENDYLSKGKKIVVIDTSPSIASSNLIQKYDAIIIPKSISDVTFQEYDEVIKEHLQV